MVISGNVRLVQDLSGEFRIRRVMSGYLRLSGYVRAVQVMSVYVG